MDLKAAALATAAKFDVHQPGWAQRINRKRFDMGSSSFCLLGQLYGDFYRSELPPFLNAPPPVTDSEFAARDRWGFENGLTCNNDDTSTGIHGEQIRELNKIWLDLIDERLPVPA